MSTDRFAACTIVAKNYIAYARVLAESFRRFHPDADLYVLLADRLDGYFDPSAEPFTLVELDALGIPRLDRLTFQYRITELSTAVKPYFLRYLLQKRDVAKVLYLDPDILVLRELAEVRSLLDGHEILLTPHLTALEQEEDGRMPGEKHILLAGAYNLGFIGLRRGPVADRLLHWWSERLARYCRIAPEVGLFVDQRWIDLVPGAFEGVHIVRHPGYNVAYWNLTYRDVRLNDGGAFANDLPVAFFHFSGFDYDRIERLSRHQDRYSLQDLPHLTPLFAEYRERLTAAGFAETRHWPYAFGRFDNGVAIPDFGRVLYWDLGDGERFGDPFQSGDRDTFWAWLREEIQPGTGVSRLWQRLWEVRGDLQSAFPDPLETQREAFLAWTRTDGQLQHAVPDELADADAHPPAPVVPHARRWGRRQVPGVNVVGYARSEKGLGEALRGMTRALTATGVPHCVVDFPDPTSANIDRTVAAAAIHNPFPINLIHVNADQLPHFVRSRGSAFLRDRYNIGYWMWELPEFPAIYHGSFAYLDEVWVASSFCLDAMSRVSPVPVVRCPISLPVGDIPVKNVGREHFGLPEKSFIFLFIFDAASIVSRKNPYALLEAFRRAFPGQEDVRLVLKLVRGDWRLRWSLRRRARDARVLLVDGVLDRPELNALIAASDCYVSLHRSEGFGVTMAEAMLLGKPVIATAYSANLDFMNADNSFLVRQTLTRLDQDHGPYRQGNVWADPDVDHAAALMRLVVQDPARARAVALRGLREAQAHLSPEAVGRTILKRLEVIAWRLAERQRKRPRVGDLDGARPGVTLPPGMLQMLRSTDEVIRRGLSGRRSAALAAAYERLRATMRGRIR